LVRTTFLDQTMEFNFDHALFFAIKRLDSPGMCLKPEQVASISAVCKGKDMKDVTLKVRIKMSVTGVEAQIVRWKHRNYERTERKN